MSRSRASIEGGYSRKTISLPSELVERIEEYLQESPGLTMSAFMTEAAEKRLDPNKGRKAKK